MLRRQMLFPNAMKLAEYSGVQCIATTFSFGQIKRSFEKRQSFKQFSKRYFMGFELKLL